MSKARSRGLFAWLQQVAADPELSALDCRVAITSPDISTKLWARRGRRRRRLPACSALPMEAAHRDPRPARHNALQNQHLI